MYTLHLKYVLCPRQNMPTSATSLAYTASNFFIGLLDGCAPRAQRAAVLPVLAAFQHSIHHNTSACIAA